MRGNGAMDERFRLTVLASGRGSNLAAILEEASEGRLEQDGRRVRIDCKSPLNSDH